MSAHNFDEILKNLAHDIASSNSIVSNLARVLHQDEPGSEILGTILKAAERTQNHVKVLQEYLSVKTRQKPDLHTVAGQDIIDLVRHRFKSINMKCGKDFSKPLVPHDFTRALDLLQMLFENAHCSEKSVLLTENQKNIEIQINAIVGSTMPFENTLEILLCEILLQDMNAKLQCTIGEKKISVRLSL